MYTFPDHCTADQIEAFPGKIVNKPDGDGFYVMYGSRIVIYELGADYWIKTNDYAVN